MKPNKAFLAGLLALSCLVAAFGADKYDKPREKEVVVVGRVILDPPVDERFFSKFWFLDSRYLTIKPDKGVKEGDVVPSAANMIFASSGFSNNQIGTTNANDVISGKINIPKDRVVTLLNFEYLPAGFYLFRIYLPVFVEFTVPDNTNYVYVGTLKYVRKGNQYELVSATRVDEFDAAQAAVKERYGADAKLVRVPLRDMEEKK